VNLRILTGINGKKSLLKNFILSLSSGTEKVWIDIGLKSDLPEQNFTGYLNRGFLGYVEILPTTHSV
jgi:hypothetical protein